MPGTKNARLFALAGGTTGQKVLTVSYYNQSSRVCQIDDKGGPSLPDFSQPHCDLLNVCKDRDGLLATIYIEGRPSPCAVRCQAKDLASFEAFRNRVADCYCVWIDHGSQHFADECDRKTKWQTTLVLAFNKGYILGDK